MRDNFIIRYDGPALVNHAIEVNNLAPALLAFRDLCDIANNEFNRGNGKVKVLASIKHEQRCFEITIELALTAYEQVKLFVNHEDTATVKDILEWIGIVAGSGVAGVSLIQLLKKTRGRETKTQKIINSSGKEFIQIAIDGDSNVITTAPQTYHLSKIPAAIKHVQTITKPLTEDGYETLEFEHKDKITERVTKPDAVAIAKIKVDGEVTDATVNTITTWLKVYSPVYDQDATKWRFEFNNTNVYIDISETDIAAQAFARGGVFIDDVYKVELEITQTLSTTGQTKESYSIKKILDFKPGVQSRQLKMDMPDPLTADRDKSDQKKSDD